MKKTLLMLMLVSFVISKEYEVENGKTLILTTKDTKAENIKINNRTYKWLQHPKNSNEKILIITIPYRTKPEISNNGDISIKVIEGNYKKEQIVVAQSKAKPNKENQQRIKKERDEANKIYATYTNSRFWDSPFINPMESVITSPYGSARIFNGEVNSYHSGTDFRAKIGTPIYAANSGKVVIAKDRFLAGKSVVIDHGEGIFSMYYHCSEIKVKLGDIVNKGDLIALSGNSGRVSGPHLHFGILARGAQVDPIDFIQKINTLFMDK
ncbi:M23 family metallopeptidase [Helicobacter sp. WB40]|uniref:M23 family metallopeptidase n=1 Tax=Helicobacter sp. WB40 TaxID=3004130 RepID=UPI0022EBC915|nr:M23 family metallopeptidase [Helicobacter sp. WB40]MDA3966894.1 M23 family metallopeptidase [Helicobacter sp. WB40]